MVYDPRARVDGRLAPGGERDGPDGIAREPLGADRELLHAEVEADLDRSACRGRELHLARGDAVADVDREAPPERIGDRVRARAVEAERGVDPVGSLVHATGGDAAAGQRDAQLERDLARLAVRRRGAAGERTRLEEPAAGCPRAHVEPLEAHDRQERTRGAAGARRAGLLRGERAKLAGVAVEVDEHAAQRDRGRLQVAGEEGPEPRSDHDLLDDDHVRAAARRGDRERPADDAEPAVEPHRPVEPRAGDARGQRSLRARAHRLARRVARREPRRGGRQHRCHREGDQRGSPPAAARARARRAPRTGGPRRGRRRRVGGRGHGRRGHGAPFYAPTAMTVNAAT